MCLSSFEFISLLSFIILEFCAMEAPTAVTALRQFTTELGGGRGCRRAAISRRGAGGSAGALLGRRAREPS